MTRDEAQRECERLSKESPDRATHSWFPREDDSGSWAVVRVNLPSTEDLKITPETHADERPPVGEDPRTGKPNPNWGGV